MTDPQTNPCGYVYDPENIAAARALFGADNSITGTAQASKLAYFNLTSYAADFLKSNPSAAGPRKLIDCGDEGMVLAPLAQQTGICSGCSHGEAAFLSWCYRCVTSGGPVPQRCSFAWAYLTGRGSRYVGRGDTGAVPSLTVRAYHDHGVLPVDGTDFKDRPAHGSNSEESLCIQYRDNPKAFIGKYQTVAEPWKCRVYSPGGAWDVADCIYTGRAVTTGGSYQCSEPRVGGNGVSGLYRLNGGHETTLVGFTVIGGQLHFIKLESWGAYPAQSWPNHRITVQTDGGPMVLYPGQCVVSAAEWMSHNPELWAISAPAEV